MEKLAGELSIKREESRDGREADEAEAPSWNRERTTEQLMGFIARREAFLRDQESRDAA